MNAKSIVLVSCLILAGSYTVNAQHKNTKPNFILILADDLGWSNTSVLMDSKNPDSKSDYYYTPNIERMAEKGIRFTQAYAPAAICCPTRRSIQFGQTPVRQGDIHFKENYHPDSNERLTIPKLLKSVDPRYKTAHYGKWDLRADIFPEDLGYDESDGNTGNKDGNWGADYIEKWTNYFLSDDPKKINSLTDRAENFIKRQVNTGNPFYLQISHYATHVEIQTKESTLEKYWRKDPGNIHGNPGFAAMLEDIDTGIGRIIDKVFELGIENNTWIFLMTDNGSVELIPQTRHKMTNPGEYGRPRLNYPLRGGKWTLYEGGIRVPFIVMGPDISGGLQVETPTAGWDILPTIAELAGYEINLPEDIDGVSLKEALTGNHNAKVNRPNNALFFHRYNDHYPHSAIIKGDYKLVKLWRTGNTELYNLAEDLEEVDDISKKYPEKVNELYNDLISYFKSVNAEILEKYEP